MTEQQPTLAEWLRASMDDAQLSAPALATASGVSRATIQRVLDPSYPFTPSRATVLKLERALKGRAPISGGLALDDPKVENSDDSDIQFVARALLGVSNILADAIHRELQGPPAISADATAAQLAHLAQALFIITPTQEAEIVQLLAVLHELDQGTALQDVSPDLVAPWLTPSMNRARMLRPSILLWESIIAITAAADDAASGLREAERMLNSWKPSQSHKEKPPHS